MPGSFKSNYAKQLSFPAGQTTGTDCQAKTGCKGNHCSAPLPGSVRKDGGRAKNADGAGSANCDYGTDSSMSVIQASTARKQTSAGLGEKEK